MLTTTALTSTSIIQQREGFIVSDMGGEKVMMGIDNGNYYNLGEVGGIIWDKIEHAISVGKLTENLASEYDISRDECEKQVLSFLDSLKHENLITIKG
ncbi:lasso peptide biosynthesis PqqD family chaperone [Fictibacillus nanhaiensis]|uniref:lasso peptide biosynthesis PqqD family chaperone n=1 Tax=Fictibacillus nanhaiensis TaxID=742169 RepID=UPI002E1F82B8|nr:lasso peptide biosynthesis PqqD family chaperone [Fictibacillus nanhaiensis]